MAMPAGEIPHTGIMPEDPSSLYIVRDPRSPEWYEGARVEAKVFIEKGYVQTSEELAREYEPYLAMSELAVARASTGEVGAAMRAMFWDPMIGFKTINDAQAGKLQLTELGWQWLSERRMAKVFEVGTLAVAPEYRGRDGRERLSMRMYGAIAYLSEVHATPYVLASFDEEYFKNFAGLFGPGVLQLGPAQDYMGSPTIPAAMRVRQVINHFATSVPELHQQLIEAKANVIHT